MECLMIFVASFSVYQLPFWRNFFCIETLIFQTSPGGKAMLLFWGWAKTSKLQNGNWNWNHKNPPKSASKVCKRQWHRGHGRQVARDGWGPHGTTWKNDMGEVHTCWTPDTLGFPHVSVERGLSSASLVWMTKVLACQGSKYQDVSKNSNKKSTTNKSKSKYC